MARPRQAANLICRVLIVSWMLVGAACSSKSTPAEPSGGSGGSTPIVTAPHSGAGAQAIAGSSAGGTAVPSAGRAGAATGAGTGGLIGAAIGGTGPASAGSGTAAGGGGSGTTSVGDGTASVLQYHKDAKRSGMYTDAAFTRAAAAMLKKDASFAGTVAGPTYAQPLYFEGGPGGVDLVITATEQNEVTAFSAADASVVWRKTLAPALTGGLACGNITPLGVTGTPVIDAPSRTLYVAAMTSGPKHEVFALSLDDGSPRMGFPVDLSMVKAPALSFVSADQNQRGALLIVNDMLFIPYGGHFGDCGQYHGWVIGVPLNASAPPSAFATQAHAGGIWAPGGLASDGTSVFAATGNTMSDSGGLFSTPSTWGHGDAILRLGPGLQTIAESATKDFFAAQNWSTLDMGDLDLGGSGPILFSVPGATPSDLVMALGKGGVAYLLSAANLGGMGGMLDMLMVAGGGSGGGMIQAATAYTTATGTFVAFRAVQQIMGCGTGSGFLGAIKVDAASPPKISVAWCAGDMATGSPFSTTTDGTSESIVWYVVGTKLLGYNGENGMPVFTGGGASDGVGTVNKFQTPIVAKGRIFLAAGNAVSAYTLH